MHIIIFRRRFTPWGVDGTMVINGKFFCGTLERSVSETGALMTFRLSIYRYSNKNLINQGISKIPINCKNQDYHA